MEMLELMADEQLHQLAQVVAMDFVARPVGGLGGVRIRHVQLSAGNPHAGRMIVAHKTVQPMMWMVECAAEVE